MNVNAVTTSPASLVHSTPTFCQPQNRHALLPLFPLPILPHSSRLPTIQSFSGHCFRSFLPWVEHRWPSILWLWRLRIVRVQQLWWRTHHTCWSWLLLSIGWDVIRCTQVLQPSNSAEIRLVAGGVNRRTGHTRRSRWHWVWSRRWWRNLTKHPVFVLCTRWSNHGSP